MGIWWTRQAPNHLNECCCCCCCLLAQKTDWATPWAQQLDWATPWAQKLDWATPWAQKLDRATPWAQKLDWATPCAQKLDWATPWAQKLDWATPWAQKLDCGHPHGHMPRNTLNQCALQCQDACAAHAHCDVRKTFPLGRPRAHAQNTLNQRARVCENLPCAAHAQRQLNQTRASPCANTPQSSWVQWGDPRSSNDKLFFLRGDTRKTSFSLTALISNIVGHTSKTQKCLPNQRDLCSAIPQSVTRAHHSVIATLAHQHCGAHKQDTQMSSKSKGPLFGNPAKCPA